MTHREEVIEEIRSFADIGYDWDSYGSIVPSQAVIERAVRWVAEADDDIIIEHVCPFSGGGIQIDHHIPKVIGFYPDGTELTEND